MAVVLFCALYALPNIYGEDHAVQVSATRGGEVTTQTLQQVESALQRESISPRGITLENDQILVRLSSDTEQLAARETLLKALGSQYIVALNLAPATPKWLDKIGGTPLKLGLDLRGGVHFLMEVDMNEALTKMHDQMLTTVRDRLIEERVRYLSVANNEGNLVVQLRTDEDYQRAVSLLRNQYQGYDTELDASTNTLRLVMTEDRKSTRLNSS